MTDEEYRELAPFVARAARIVSRKWPNVADRDDIEQEIWFRLIESPGSITRVLEMEDARRESALAVIGHQRAAIERDEYALFSGNVYYSTHDVRAILAKVDDQESLTLTDRLDMGIAFEELRDDNDKYADILYAEFWLGSPIHEDTKQLTRAVDRLTTLMNRVHRSQRYEKDGLVAKMVVVNG